MAEEWVPQAIRRLRLEKSALKDEHDRAYIVYKEAKERLDAVEARVTEAEREAGLTPDPGGC